MNDYNDMSAETYEKLYARYLKRPGRLLYAPDPAVSLTSQTRLLDLCAGSGALIRQAIKAGLSPSNIVAVEEAHTFAGHLHRLGPISVVHGTVTYLGLYDKLEADERPFDLITCRQAVNYWWDIEVVEKIVGLLRKSGCFVFNTFNTKPTDTPHTKQYVYEERQYAEIAYCIGETVHHVQACEGLPMHSTTFRWIPPEVFDDDLNRMIERNCIEEWDCHRKGHTDTYVLRTKV